MDKALEGKKPQMHPGEANDILEAGQRYASLKLCTHRNRIKTSSLYLPYEYLLARIKDEVRELENAMIVAGLLAPVQHEGSLEDVGFEAGDIINFASMICYKLEQQG